MSFVSQRQRVTAQPFIQGSLAEIMRCAFGCGSPANQLSSPNEVLGIFGNLYQLHEGDLFTPGTGNWVLDPAFDTPLMAIWGHGSNRQPNTFNPFQPVQVIQTNTLTLQGMGGLIAGQMALAPLREPAPEQGG